MNRFVEKLIEKFEERKKYNQSILAAYTGASVNVVFEAQMNTYNNAIEIIKELAEEYNNGWIPCNEKQPEIRGAYLVTTKVNDFLRVQIMSYDGKAWIGPINTVDYGDVSNRVFAWQPLPETYKG